MVEATTGAVGASPHGNVVIMAKPLGPVKPASAAWSCGAWSCSEPGWLGCPPVPAARHRWRQPGAGRAAHRRFRELWCARHSLTDGWQHPVNVAGDVIEDTLEPAAAAGDVPRFEGFDRYIRSDLLEAPDWERRAGGAAAVAPTARRTP
jgi:hypothetical protein